jgi:hypothetical protein
MNIPETAWPWTWWSGMVAINVVNITICLWCFRQSRNAPDGDSTYMKRMRWMGLIFSVVAFYRSIFVSRYFIQQAWFDTVANSSLLIRMLAWCAELSFAGLFAFAMLRFNKDIPDPHPSSNPIVAFIKTRSPYVLITCLFLAQFFVTVGLIIKSGLLFAIENSLWTLGFYSILPLALIQCKRAFTAGTGEQQPRLRMLKAFAVVNLAWLIIYCTYQGMNHLPPDNWARAINQVQTGVPELRTGLSAVSDALLVVHVTRDASDWPSGFIFWHSCYFSVCVWLAIFLMRGPRIRPTG